MYNITIGFRCLILTLKVFHVKTVIIILFYVLYIKSCFCLSNKTIITPIIL